MSEQDRVIEIRQRLAQLRKQRYGDRGLRLTWEATMDDLAWLLARLDALEADVDMWKRNCSEAEASRDKYRRMWEAVQLQNTNLVLGLGDRARPVEETKA
jgi:hypothetical protein